MFFFPGAPATVVASEHVNTFLQAAIRGEKEELVDDNESSCVAWLYLTEV